MVYYNQFYDIRGFPHFWWRVWTRATILRSFKVKSRYSFRKK